MCVQSVRHHFWNAPTQRHLKIQQAMTNPWHFQSTSRVFSKSGMHGCIQGKQKQWLERVTGSALISVSSENAEEFSTIVRSLQEVISFPINYVPCRSNRPLRREWPSLLSYVCAGWSKHTVRQRGESSSQWCACPLIFLTENNGHLITNGTRTQRSFSSAKRSKEGESNHYPKTCSIM